MAAPAGRRGVLWYAFRLRMSTDERQISLPLLIAVLGLAVALYGMTAAYNQRVDVTRAKRFTLADQSVELLQTLQRPIEVIGFFRRAGLARKQFTDLLQQYAHHAEQITYEVVDLDRQPDVAKQYGVTAFNTIVVAGEEREERVFHLAEEALTNAISKVARANKKTIYFTTGHGEPSITDTGRSGYSLAKQRLEKQNYDVKELPLARRKRLPEDAAVVVLAGPRSDLTEAEISALSAYLEAGGHVVLMLDPQGATGLVSFVARYGITLGRDWVIETNALGRLFGGDYHMPAATASAGHPITDALSGSGAMTIFPVVRSVGVGARLPDGVQVQTLMSTSPQSWAETDLQALDNNRSAFDKGRDRRGPIGIAVIATATSQRVEGGGGSRRHAPVTHLVVIGDSEFASNRFITLQGNGDFFINAVSWLAEEEDRIIIRPRWGGDRSPVALTATQVSLLFWLPVVVLPLAVCAAGAIVCRRRRRQP